MTSPADEYLDDEFDKDGDQPTMQLQQTRSSALIRDSNSIIKADERNYRKPKIVNKLPPSRPM